MNKSIWSEYTQKPQFDSLQKDIECEVLVIGGGIAGLLTAHFLQKQGKQVVLVEAKYQTVELEIIDCSNYGNYIFE